MPIPILDRKIRCALIGCGRVAQKHFAALEALGEDLELVGVCDRDEDALSAAAYHLGVPGFLDDAVLLTEVKPDLVILATPSALHPEQTMRAARAGAHVMTEKPMATRWADAMEMVEVCEEAGVHLFVVKQIRYNPVLRKLKSAIDERRFGRIYMVDCNVFWTRPQTYYDSAQWRGTWEYDGGALMNQASHYVDLLPWLIGPVESVHAFAGPLARHIEVEDTGVVSLRWRSGTLGTLAVTMLTYPKNFEASMTVLGERGTVRIGGSSCHRVEHWEFDEPRDETTELDEAMEMANSVLRAGHTHYYRDAVARLRGQAVNVTDGREGLKSLEVIIAAYRSVMEDRRVALPFEL
ncbi:MAG: Gfo/Idh/MocA family protein [Bradymonadaceae bacterium]